MSLLELQRRMADELLGPAGGGRMRPIVRGKRRRLLAESCPRSFRHVTCEVVDAFLDAYDATDLDLEGEARAFLAFAAARAGREAADLCRYELLTKTLGIAAGIDTFGIDLRAAWHGRLRASVARRWIVSRHAPPVPLDRVRETSGGG